jgi:hypothetical protein
MPRQKDLATCANGHLKGPLLRPIYTGAGKNLYYEGVNGGDMASTQVAKPQAHAEDVTYLVNHVAKNIVANDDNYALAA